VSVTLCHAFVKDLSRDSKDKNPSTVTTLLNAQRSTRTLTKARISKMAYTHWRESLLKTANVITYLLFLGSNICTVTLIFPLLIHPAKQTYFTPTDWAFLVWPIIHILLFGTVIYQFASARGKAVVVDGISWELPLMNILYALFVTLRFNHHYTAAFVVSLLLSYVIGNIYWSLKKEYLPQSVGDHLFVHLPFTACQAWTAFMGYLVAFEAFGVDAAENTNGIFTNLFVFFAL
jgi:hypothetical protein